jgi:hypothetical protein
VFSVYFNTVHQVKGMMMNSVLQNPNVEKLLEKVKQEILSGVKHGFFDYQITCEIIQGKKRKITVKTGKSHRFFVSEEEL